MSLLNLVDILRILYVGPRECLELLKGHLHLETRRFCCPFVNSWCIQFWSTVHSPAWNPCLKQDILLIERVQRHLTGMIPCLSELPYQSRLDLLGIMSLHLRHCRADPTEVFHLVHYGEDVNHRVLFTLTNTGVTRGHALKVMSSRC